MALAEQAEIKLCKLHFDNKNRNFPWTKFTSMVRQLFLDLGDRDQMSEERKVRKIMNAWRVPNLMYARGVILRDPDLMGDSEAVMTYLGTLLASEGKQQSSSRNISGVTTEKDDSTIANLERKIAALEKKHANFKKRPNTGGSFKSNKKQKTGKKGKSKALDRLAASPSPFPSRSGRTWAR